MTLAPASALDPRTLFHDLDSTAPLIVAVSGGSDSIALLHLVSTWAATVDAEVHVVTVDHGLRPEAAAEAAFVAGVSEGLGLSHFTLAWEGVKPSSGISEAARYARYRLLSEFAEDMGVKTILTGHTMDDQAETIWMRNSRIADGVQYRGLAGMGHSTVLEGDVRIVRPLLNVKRKQLRKHLLDIGQTWIEDPTNFDVSYERVRARHAIELSEIGIASIARFASICSRYRRMDSECVATFLRDELIIDDGLVLSVSFEKLGELGAERAALVVQVLVALAGGRPHFIAREMAELSLLLLPGTKHTAGYCVLENQRGRLTVYREARNLPIISIGSGQTGIWDERLEITNRSNGVIVCRAAERTDIRRLEDESEIELDVFPRGAVAALPIVQTGDGQGILPFTHSCGTLDGVAWKLVSPAIDRYRPDHDEAFHTLLLHLRTAGKLVKS